jgi:hypothetical protein
MEGGRRDSVIGIATPFWAAKPGIKRSWVASIFVLSQTGHRSYSTTFKMGTCSFLRINKSRCGGYHPLLLVTMLKEE